MNRKFTGIRSAQSGFSLVELLVVIVLLGVIMAVVLPRVGSAGDSGKYKGAKNQLIRLTQAVETFQFEMGRYPESLTELVDKPGDGEFWSGPYIQRSLLQDPWGTDWVFNVPGDDTDFDIITYAKGGTPGGDGYAKDISNWD